MTSNGSDEQWRDVARVTQAHTPAKHWIDPRGPRFGAALTSCVLAVALITESPVLLALQSAVFAIGAFAGPAKHPYGLIFRALVRPKLGPAAHLEDPAAPRFAQLCGLVFGMLGLTGFALGWSVLALGAMAVALAAAFLNAAFDYCIGCEVYLLVHRVRQLPAP
jgi:hypothetical protein